MKAFEFQKLIDAKVYKKDEESADEMKTIIYKEVDEAEPYLPLYLSESCARSVESLSEQARYLLIKKLETDLWQVTFKPTDTGLGGSWASLRLDIINPETENKTNI